MKIEKEKSEEEMVVIHIKMELHRMLYSADFHNVKALMDGLERLIKKQFNPSYMWPTMSIREATFFPRTESESLHELKCAAYELEDMWRTLETLRRKISHMATDKEIEIFKAIANETNKKGE